MNDDGVLTTGNNSNPIEARFISEPPLGSRNTTAKVEDICRQMCLNDGIDPDASSGQLAPNGTFHLTNWSLHVDAVEKWLKLDAIEKAAAMVRERG